MHVSAFVQVPQLDGQAMREIRKYGDAQRREELLPSHPPLEEVKYPLGQRSRHVSLKRILVAAHVVHLLAFDEQTRQPALQFWQEDEVVL